MSDKSKTRKLKIYYCDITLSMGVLAYNKSHAREVASKYLDLFVSDGDSVGPGEFDSVREIPSKSTLLNPEDETCVFYTDKGEALHVSDVLAGNFNVEQVDLRVLAAKLDKIAVDVEKLKFALGPALDG